MKWAAGVATGLLLLVVGFFAGREGGTWLAAQSSKGQRGVDRFYAVGGIALMHDGCDPVLTGWHLSRGQPVRLDEC